MDKSILFNTQMIQALLDGRKTQTRRIVKPQPPEGKFVGDCHHSKTGFALWKENGCTCNPVPCPYFAEYLWVRETWAVHWMYDDVKPSLIDLPSGDSIWYMSSNIWDVKNTGKWRPSIFMPRWASRLTLHIKDIRVERVRDISESDSKSEGAESCDVSSLSQDEILLLDYPHLDKSTPYKNDFSALWNSINNNWDDNPFVWCVDFEVIKKNIDKVINNDN